MIAKYTFLVALLLSLLDCKTLLADDAADRAKLRDALMEREVESWGMMKKKDVPAMKEFLADDVVLIFYDAIRLNKTEMLKSMPDYKLESFTVEGKPDIVMPTPDVATILYRITYTSAMKDEKPRKVTVVSSSTYVRRGGKWSNVFYQETLAK
ncbi:MAG: nuclear transport factor 2 family protein [Planctomycetes bacterium]|nr:nuclear transport factor 2 family protein [Planctomycetota bacterium]